MCVYPHGAAVCLYSHGVKLCIYSSGAPCVIILEQIIFYRTAVFVYSYEVAMFFIFF